MTHNDKTPGLARAPKAGARFRRIGMIILFAGLGVAGWVLWAAPALPKLPDDFQDEQTSRKAERAVEMNFGKSGLFAGELADDLKDPGTQALLIAIASILVAGGCFYIGHVQDRVEKSDATCRPR